MDNQNGIPNRLIHEKSPYLLQHAHNPVDWHPWGDEAFEEARRRDVPVFLSIGYSSCHWCHVMERECFEDREVASMLNDGFVPVKVDREERPDVDHLYMEACTALTGSGGWPLTCFLDHDRRPFYAGTYYPKLGRAGMPGLMDVLDRIGHLWHNDRGRIGSAAASVTQYLNARHPKPTGGQTGDAAAAAYAHLEQSFDARFGGFGTAPKFPAAHNLLFLLRYGLMYQQSRAHAMVGKTLAGMAAGGMFDHIGGGFCRYSTDPRWLVPHFEKMLYDNAMLAMAYGEASAALGEPMYADVTRRTVEYCFRRLLGGHGGFFTAEDADSAGVEGKSYLWTPAEIADVLGPADGDRFCELYGITKGGNFEGGSIPNLIGKGPTEDDRAFAAGCFGRLLERRLSREQPFLDDKVLAAGNGLMVAALAVCGRLLGEAAWVGQAEKTARFVLDNLVQGGRLMASWREGRATGPATSDDYSYFVWGLMELYQATHKPEWLRAAVDWADGMLRLFWDGEEGALYLTGEDVADLPLRQKNTHDGALPSGNSAAALNLLRLARITGNEEYEKRSSAILDALAPFVSAYPPGGTALLCTRLYLQSLGTEIVIANGSGLAEMLKVAEAWLPFATVSVRGEGYEAMNDIAPFTVAMDAKDGKATAYICSKGACLQPVTDPKALQELLDGR